MVTEQLQYSVPFCFFSTWHNTEILLISNDLRFIFASLLLLALPITFHGSRHTFGSLQVEAGTSIYVVQKMLAHKNVETTQIYADMADEQKRLSVSRITLKPTADTETQIP